jgi:hypothetical protein
LQQQIQVGIAGQLAGITLEVSGEPGETFTLSIRNGPAWNTSAPVFEQTGAIVAPGQPLFIDMTSADLFYSVSDLFVMDVTGDSGAILLGSFIAPPAPPPYSRPFYEAFPARDFQRFGWSIGFETYMTVTGL